MRGLDLRAAAKGRIPRECFECPGVVLSFVRRVSRPPTSPQEALPKNAGASRLAMGIPHQIVNPEDFSAPKFQAGLGFGSGFRIRTRVAMIPEESGED